LAHPLRDVLLEAQRAGFIGPGCIDDHIRRALDLADGLPDTVRNVLDLGSGGGLPGLPLILAKPAWRWWLLDGSARRAQFLTNALTRLGVTERAQVVPARAEEAARTPLRQSFDAVVSRGFGPPAVTAECAAPFLKVSGLLLVAEPPGDELPGRWDRQGLLMLGLVVDRRSEPGRTSWQTFRQVEPCPERYPRRTGIPLKRPLF